MFKTIKGFSKYEISDTGLVRSKKNKSFVSMEGGSLRLYNDAGVRVTVKKENLEPVAEIMDVDFEELQVEEPKEEVFGGVIDNTPEEPEKPKPTLKKPTLKKPKKEKSRVLIAVKQAVKDLKKPKPFEMTQRMKNILAKEGAKSGKMKDLKEAGATIGQIAKMLETHYSYVYNYLNGYYSKK